jgi:hypothetical protein
MSELGSAVMKGVAAGLIAGIPQVLVVQIETRFFGLPRGQADIGPRFVQRVAQQADASLSPPLQWLLAALFHFGYAAQWGTVYALIHELHPTPPLVGGPQLAALIYSVAFSPWGAATQTGTERPPEYRSNRETLLHWTAALSFSLTAAYAFRWLRGEPRSERVKGALSDWKSSLRAAGQ